MILDHLLVWYFPYLTALAAVRLIYGFCVTFLCCFAFMFMLGKAVQGVSEPPSSYKFPVSQDIFKTAYYPMTVHVSITKNQVLDHQRPQKFPSSWQLQG